MPIDFQLASNPPLIRTSITGTIEAEDVRRYFQAITSAPDLPPSTPALVDLTETDFGNFNAQFGEQLIALREQFPDRVGARLALLVSDDVGYGVSRIYQILSADLPGHLTAVFREESEALAWLLQD